MIPVTTHKADFKKLNPDQADADKEGYSAISRLTGIDCNIQPASAEPSEMATGVFDRKHVMFVPITASGIRTGYRCTVSGHYAGEENREFRVEGVQDWSKGPAPHYQLNLSEIRE